MGKIKKIFTKIKGESIKLLLYINFHWYMRNYVKHLKKLGVKLDSPAFISPDAKFDGTDYSLIEIGDKSVISTNVLLLTHDFSLFHAFYAAGYEMEGVPNRVKGIRVGKNSFVGANCTLLPGTTVGDNSIIGAGSVLRGSFPDNSIIMGNPAKVVANTVDWIEKKVEVYQDYKKFVKGKRIS